MRREVAAPSGPRPARRVLHPLDRLEAKGLVAGPQPGAPVRDGCRNGRYRSPPTACAPSRARKSAAGVVDRLTVFA